MDGLKAERKQRGDVITIYTHHVKSLDAIAKATGVKRNTVIEKILDSGVASLLAQIEKGVQ